MFKDKLIKIFYLLLIIIPISFVFRNIFKVDVSVFGDAPYFYPDTLTTLFSEPLVWITRGFNFGGINQMLWLSPMMVIYGALGKYLLLNSQTVVLILFYIPAITFSVIGTYLLTRYLKFSETVSFFTTLFYSLNTYFILLIDGGQLGIALAYGIFPIVLFFLRKLVDALTIANFFRAYVFGMALCIIDPRIYAILVLLLVIWAIQDKKNIKFIFILQIPILLSNLYWLYPLIMTGMSDISYSVLNLQSTSLLNSLLLYAPHWPNNIFGKIIPPPFYFSIVPILVFGSLLFKDRHKNVKNLSILFLILTFLSKGTGPPFGEIYNFLVTKIPFAVSFRDSSKFFIPLMLIGGILIGETIDKIKNIKFVKLIAYIIILLLVWQSLLGKLNFNLSGKISNSDFNKIYINLKNDENFYKTLWFPEKNPMSYETNNKSALDARELVKITSIAVINASNDPFNFLNNINFPQKLARLGIKYIFLSGDPRNLDPTENEIKDWNMVTKLVAENPNLKRINWNTSFPIFEISNILPKFYKVNYIIGVIGPYVDSNIPAIYFEDGKLDPRLLEGKDPNSVKLFFNGTNNLDLSMSFLQKYFISTNRAVLNEWAYYPNDNYLKAKYELLIRGVEYNDFDYKKGLSFSTIRGEKIKFSFKVPKNDEYVLLTRKLNKLNKFEWKIVNEKLFLKKGKFNYELINESELEVVNVVALVPKKDFDDAQKLSQVFKTHFGIVNNINSNLFKWDNTDLIDEGTLKYKLIPKETGFWLVLNENYNSLWMLRRGIESFPSVPIDSQVNGFYFEPKWNDLHIEFKGQEYFRWGLYYALVSILITLIILLYLNIENE